MFPNSPEYYLYLHNHRASELHEIARWQHAAREARRTQPKSPRRWSLLRRRSVTPQRSTPSTSHA